MTDPFDFEAFWAAYPRKQAKGPARKAFAKALTLTTLPRMLAALEWQRTQPQWTKDGGDYIPLPATWLNQERWDDEVPQVPRHPQAVGRRPVLVGLPVPSESQDRAIEQQLEAARARQARERIA